MKNLIDIVFLCVMLFFFAGCGAPKKVEEPKSKFDGTIVSFEGVYTKKDAAKGFSELELPDRSIVQLTNDSIPEAMSGRMVRISGTFRTVSAKGQGIQTPDGKVVLNVSSWKSL